MSTHKVEIFVHYRAKHGEDVKLRHEELVARMIDVSVPLGWSGLKLPPVPDFGEELLATFSMKYTEVPIHLYVDYVFREPSYTYKDETIFDDKMVLGFRVPNQKIIFSDMLARHLPAITLAFRGYMSKVYFDSYFLDYQDLHADSVEKLETRTEIDLDGRNNIFTLHPAQYWDAELCRKALGYGPDEVMRRLDGKVPLVQPLMDGVFTIFSDDPNLSFDEFCAINDRFKPILGLV